MIRIFRWFFSTLLATLLVSCAVNLPVSAGMAAMAERYPPGSIQTWSLFTAALADVATARDAVDARFQQTQAQCFTKFFAARCSDATKERRRLDLSLLRKIEIEANAFERKARAADRDLSLSERQRQAGNAPVKILIPQPGEIRITKPIIDNNDGPVN